jgi:hypothetical protein
MAWIKLDHLTPDKPEVIGMAEILGIDQDAVLGKLCRIWIWADQQTIGGSPLRVSEVFLDRVSNSVGFSKAMISVGWLKPFRGLFGFPNFEYHNGETAKKRAESAKRMERSRAKKAQQEAQPKPQPEEEEEEEDIPTEYPRDETGKIPSETRRDETSFCAVDWERVKSDAKRFNGTGIDARRPMDRSLVLKACALAQSRIPRSWIEDAIEALKFKARKNPAAYLTAILKKKAAAVGEDFRALLAETKLPEEASNGESHGA